MMNKLKYMEINGNISLFLCISTCYILLKLNNIKNLPNYYKKIAPQEVLAVKSRSEPVGVHVQKCLVKI